MTECALLFTDVVDSTQLVERLGDARAAEVWASHDRRARELLARHGGREIDRTDGFFLLFDDALDAAHFAVDYHDALRALGMAARVGLHVGAVTLRENSPQDVARGAKPVEVEGVAKPLAARVMALARGEQVLLTAAARAALAEALPEGIHLERHGHYRLKGIEEPVEIFELGLRGVARFAPPPDGEKAYRVVRGGDRWSPVREIRHNLAAERDTFVGRSSELAAFAGRLEAGQRLVSVVGPGGTGKTRFVRRYGWTWLGDWPGGVYFCDLSEARTLDGIFFAVASALEVPLGKDDPAVQLGHAIAGRGRCLVILDNFEQVVEHAEATVGGWLEHSSEAVFAVTSRERLHVTGEEVFPIEPLPVMEEGIELFALRARAQRPDFMLNDTNRSAVAEVVRLLDGLPLAIELAAARVRVLSPEQLVVRMRDRFQILAGARGAAARQATMRAAIDWSWDLLAPWEQQAFAQCSVFEGGFTLEAAEAVVDLARWPEAPPPMDVLQTLAEKSLLRTWVPSEHVRYGFDEPYFGMYVSIREYAAEKLDASGSAAKTATEARHGAYFASLGTDEAIEALTRHGGVRRRRTLALELDNLVAACRRALVRDDRDTAVGTYRATWEVLVLQGPYSLGVTLGEQVAALPELPDALRISAIATLAKALQRAGRVKDAEVRLDQALALAGTTADTRREGKLHTSLGNLHREQGRFARAMQHYEAALASARRVGDRACEGASRSGLGLVDREQGRTEDARRHFDAALALARDSGDRREEGVVLGSLGLLQSECGNVEEARTLLESALAIAGEVGDRQLQGVIHANLAQLHSEQGRVDEARSALEVALAIHREIGNRRLEAIALGNLGPLCVLQGLNAEAQAFYEAAIAIARQVGNRRHQSFLLCSLGIMRHGQGRLQEARADYDDALALAREVGDPRGEAIAESRLGQLCVDQAQLDEARKRYECALALARQVGYRRLEGVVLGGMGGLLAREGRTEEALDAVRAGEALLREVADREELGKLLCIRGGIEVTLGTHDLAHAALAEAEAIAKAMRSGTNSELSREIAALRDTLARGQPASRAQG